MSRGGRGGGRGGGGRGGGRGAGGPKLPWDAEEPDSRPMDVFPPYNPNAPSALSPTEERQVASFLRFRTLTRMGPLYTAYRARQADVAGSRTKAYSQEQVNELYGTKTKATVDPFTAMDTWERRQQAQPRALPDFSRIKFCKSSFPDELHAVIDPRSARKQNKSTSWFAEAQDGDLTTAELSLLRNHDVGVEEKLAELSKGISDDIDGALPVDEDEESLKDEDDGAYDDDEDAGDYNAEGYFDDGDGDGEDDRGGGDDEGTY